MTLQVLGGAILAIGIAYVKVSPFLPEVKTHTHTHTHLHQWGAGRLVHHVRQNLRMGFMRCNLLLCSQSLRARHAHVLHVYLLPFLLY